MAAEHRSVMTAQDPVSEHIEHFRREATLVYLRGRSDGIIEALAVAREVVEAVCRRPDGTWDTEARNRADAIIAVFQVGAARRAARDVYEAFGEPEKAARALAGAIGDEEADEAGEG